ncbi:MAG: ankyrin repeat domain-containing protein, partial [Deltaproteobacteria bacterium]|nr:ankyrin repeat domain-containing protein [Deltaproteobacteria bacterium]
SALHAAARGGAIAILDRCIAKSCPFDLDDKGRTALHHAALGGTADMLRVLAARGLDLEARDHDNYTPLATCASYLNTPVYDTLLELGADESTGEAIRKAKIAEQEAFVAQFR